MVKDKSKKLEPKLVLEREYTVPLRREWVKVVKHKRANRAVKALKRFLAKHMKIYDRDLNKIKIDRILNNEIRFRGMRKPPAKIRIKAKKFDDNIVRAELVDIPEHIKFERLREEKIKKIVEKKVEEKVEEKEEVKKVESQEAEKKEEKVSSDKSRGHKEKEEASKEESLKIAEKQAKEQKHVSKDKKVLIHRRALAR